MTNNYFKVYHYVEIMNLRVDVRTLLFFFDDEDPRSKARALCSALACMSTIGALTSGRQVQLSVYRKLEVHPAIDEIGAAEK